MRLIIVILLIVPVADLIAQKRDSLIGGGRGIENYPYPYKNFRYISPFYIRTNYGNRDFYENYNIRSVLTVKGHDHFRLDLPLARTNMTSDGRVDFGLDDISFRFTQYLFRIKHLFLGYKIGAVFPTATSGSMGTGKWQLQPGIGGAYFFGPKDDKGSVLFAVEYRFSVAGDQNRDDINILAIIPNIDIWRKKWYLGYYATWTYNFDTEKFDLPLDVEFGYHICHNLVIATEFIYPLIKDVTYNNSIAFKLRYTL